MFLLSESSDEFEAGTGFSLEFCLEQGFGKDDLRWRGVSEDVFMFTIMWFEQYHFYLSCPINVTYSSNNTTFTRPVLSM